MGVGERGPKGDHGQTGDMGDTGLRGERGGQGGYGERGDQGQRGDMGRAGERGPTGDTGQRGGQGERGFEGKRADLPSRLGAWMLVAVIAGTAALFLLPYSAADKIRNTQLAACEAGKIDRGLQADSWEAAYKVRLATANDPAATPLQRHDAAKAAGVYKTTYERLRSRSDERYQCGEVYPKPSLLPF